MSTITYCAEGCTVRGNHLVACESEACRGCEPRQAATGLLCAWGFQRLSADIATVPDLVRHLRDIGQPHAQMAPPSDTTTYRDPAEGSILPEAWLAADELHANLASWALLILEEHPDGQQMAGPDEIGAWHTRYGTVVGIAHVAATERLVRWLLPHLDWCAGQQWAPEMRREIGEVVATTSARWPTAAMVEPTRHVAVPCPRCDRQSLTYTPPAFAEQPFVVSCSNPDCARVFSEDEWERFKQLALRVGGR